MFIQVITLEEWHETIPFYCLAFLLLLVQPGLPLLLIRRQLLNGVAAVSIRDLSPRRNDLAGQYRDWTSAFTYYFEKTGTFEVRVWKKGYENYTDTVTVVEGKRIVFHCRSHAGYLRSDW